MGGLGELELTRRPLLKILSVLSGVTKAETLSEFSLSLSRLRALSFKCMSF